MFVPKPAPAQPSTPVTKPGPVEPASTKLTPENPGTNVQPQPASPVEKKPTSAPDPRPTASHEPEPPPIRPGDRPPIQRPEPPKKENVWKKMGKGMLGVLTGEDKNNKDRGKDKKNKHNRDRD